MRPLSLLLLFVALSAPLRLCAGMVVNGDIAARLAFNHEQVRGPDMGGGVGGVLYSLRSPGNITGAKFYHYNTRGDVIAQTDHNPLFTYLAMYNAYGQHNNAWLTAPDWGSSSDRHRSNTRDEEPTGLFHENHRYRDIEANVYITRDPAGFVDGPNQYTYVKQNPFTHIDADGLGAGPPRAPSAGPTLIDPMTGRLVPPGSVAARRVYQQQVQLQRDREEFNRRFNTADPKYQAEQRAIQFQRMLAQARGEPVRPMMSAGPPERSPEAPHRPPTSPPLQAQGTSGTVTSSEPLARLAQNTNSAANSPPAPPSSSMQLLWTNNNSSTSLLYRGVPSGDSPRAVQGRQGVVQPRGTALDSESLGKHVRNERVDSGVTSWTTNRDVARTFSGSEGTIIEVPASRVQSQIVPRPDVGKYNHESEVLLKGTVQGKPTTP